MNAPAREAIAEASVVAFPARPLLDPRDPLPSARAFVARDYTRDGLRILHHHRGAFHAWTGAAYAEADGAAIRAALYRYLEGADRMRDGQRVPFMPNATRVNDMLDALRAVTNLSAAIEPPAWLYSAPTDAHPATEFLPVANGLLHLPSRLLWPATPAFFGLNALPYAFDDAAGPPRALLAFLDSMLGDDAEATALLQEWAGLMLMADTRHHKALLIVGPKRSGKGTFGRVLTAMLGQANVAGPTLASLGDTFGLEPLIGKSLAIVADARLGARADQQAIAERLLTLSGEDPLTIHRKHRIAWHGRLGVRFMLLSNELPRIADASGALASRFLVVNLTRSFYGIEDHDLTDRLLAELPAILNWALDGLDRLRQRGRFVQPASAAEAIAELEDLGSPIGAFVRDSCSVGPTEQVECGALFHAWATWCKAQGRDYPGTAQSFGRDLRAAASGVRVVNLRDGVGGRTRFYEGIALNRWGER